MLRHRPDSQGRDACCLTSNSGDMHDMYDMVRQASTSRPLVCCPKIGGRKWRDPLVVTGRFGRYCWKNTGQICLTWCDLLWIYIVILSQDDLLHGHHRHSDTIRWNEEAGTSVQGSAVNGRPAPLEHGTSWYHWFKALRHDWRGVSCCPPPFYASRFCSFLEKAKLGKCWKTPWVCW